MCSKGGAKVGLVISSSFLIFISLAMLGCGVVCVIGNSVYSSQLDFLRTNLDTAATDIGATNLDESNLDILFITRPLGIVLIVFGTFIFVIGILGAVAGYGRFHTFLVVYCVMLGCLAFAQFVVTICAYVDRTPFDDTVKQMLKDSLLDWTGIDGEDATTLGWNAIMSFFRCCGVDDYTDAAAASGWTKTIDGTDQSTNLVTPFICCEVKSSAPGCAQGDTNQYITQTYYDRGCYQLMWDYVTSDTGVVIFLVFFIFFFQFLCLFFAVWLICSWKSKEGTSQVSSDFRYQEPGY